MAEISSVDLSATTSATMELYAIVPECRNHSSTMFSDDGATSVFTKSYTAAIT